MKTRLHISMWMLHRWFEEQGIAHECDIKHEEYEIYGIRYEQYEYQQENFAIVYDTRLLRGYEGFRTIIRHKDNILLFPEAAPSEVLNQANGMMSAWRQWEKDIKKINISHGSVIEILRRTEKILPAPILLLHGQSIVAYSEMWKTEIYDIYQTFLQADYQQICKEDRKGGILEELYSRSGIEMVTKSYWGNKNRIMCNIWVDGVRLMRLIVFDMGDKVSGGDMYIINELAKAIQTSLKQNLEKYIKHDQNEFALQTLYVKNDVDKGQLSKLLRNCRWHQTDYYKCYCIETNLNISVFAMEKLMGMLREENSKWRVFSTESQIILISVPEDQEIQEKEWLIQFCKDRNCILGISCIGREWTALPQYIRQAQRFSEQASIRNLNYFDGANHRAEFIYSMLSESQWYQSLVLPQVRVLQDVDKQENCTWCETLEVFLRCGCNQVAAARQLGIHRTTLNYRLERIRNLIGDEWEEIENRQLYLISFLISNKR